MSKTLLYIVCVLVVLLVCNIISQIQLISISQDTNEKMTAIYNQMNGLDIVGIQEVE